MTAIRLRHVDWASSAHLGDAPLTQHAMDDVLRLVKSWGVVMNGEDVDTMTSVGQFVVTDGQAYFEVVVGAEL